jgi:hypothetical protein
MRLVAFREMIVRHKLMTIINIIVYLRCCIVCSAFVRLTASCGGGEKFFRSKFSSGSCLFTRTRLIYRI